MLATWEALEGEWGLAPASSLPPFSPVTTSLCQSQTYLSSCPWPLVRTGHSRERGWWERLSQGGKVRLAKAERELAPRNREEALGRVHESSSPKS